jgi:hypothetical protein
VATAYSDLVAGTAVTWTSSGGDKVLTATSLTNGSAREGDKSDTWVDGTKGLPALVEVRLETAVGSAATAGNMVELYVGESDDADAGDANPGNLTGADAGLSNPDELTPQLTFVGALVLSNARGTNVQKQRFRFKPVCAYSVPVLYNRSGQTLSGTGTNTKVVMTPYYRRAPVS